MTDNIWPYLTIILIAVTVFITRVAGAEIMTYFTITPRIEAILNSMALSVLIAIVATEVTQGGLRESIVTLVVLGFMVLFKKAVAAMLMGIAVAAGWMWFV